MRNQVRALIGGFRQTLSLLRSRPALERPDWFLVSSRESLVRLKEDLEDTARALLERSRSVLVNVASRLDALSPLKILGRGFSLTRRISDGAIVRDYASAPRGTKVQIALHSGSLDCLVEDSKPAKEGDR
jgi:exodeoxyribonuclease VII large subunit